MKQITFNTGRYYAPEGQIIRFTILGGKIYFQDKTWCISGVLRGSFDYASASEVTSCYDRGQYDDCKYPYEDSPWSI